MNAQEAVLQQNILNLKEAQTKCENRQKEEHDRIYDQINEQTAKLEKTKIGIYNQIEKDKVASRHELKEAIGGIKNMIKKDLTDPFEDLKKKGIKILLAMIAGGFTVLLGFIYWLLQVTNVLGNLELLIGG